MVNAPNVVSSQGRLSAWLLAARLPTLPAAIVPVLVGTAAAIAQGHFAGLPFAGALVAALLIQVGTNLANDYFDYRKGADTGRRVGPTRVTQSGLIAPEAVKTASMAVFGAAVLVGLYLVTVGGWPILVIGLLSVAAGVLYTGGPWPFGYHGLGDLFVFVFFGLVAVAGTFYLHAGYATWPAIYYAIPVGLLVTAILVVNNVRDIDTDRATGKRTLAVTIGRRASRYQYIVLVLGAYLLLPARWLVEPPSIWHLLPWLTLPLAAGPLRAVLAEEAAALNPALRGTARLHLLFGILFAVSLLR